MYSVTVRDHMMIAHSLAGASFGPAQNLHGATYIVDATFKRPQLDAANLVVDIARAGHVLGHVTGALTMRNLNDDPAFAGINTTTEYLAGVVFDRLAAAIHSGELGESGHGLTQLAVTLHESHIAWASYAGNL